MTLTEIAKLAGVSAGTVDRVLHNRKGVSEKTKIKISLFWQVIRANSLTAL